MAYPEFRCTGGPFTTDINGGVFNGIYNPADERTFAFLQDVLTEVIGLFPGKYIHIGGDEVLPDTWHNSPAVQALMQSKGLKNEAEVQSYFIRRIETFINAQGRTLIGWSEIRNGGLAPNAALMDWIGGATEGARTGHDVVMSPQAFCYFDRYQSRNRAGEPRAQPGYLPLSQVYAFEPVPADLPAEFQSHILGAQANLWSEYIPSLWHVEYMAYPRLSALAEVLWSPKAARNWDDFLHRLPADCRRLDKLGINYHPITDLVVLVAPPP
jgi:hexosaminidase